MLILSFCYFQRLGRYQSWLAFAFVKGLTKLALASVSRPLAALAPFTLGGSPAVVVTIIKEAVLGGMARGLWMIVTMECFYLGIPFGAVCVVGWSSRGSLRPCLLQVGMNTARSIDDEVQFFLSPFLVVEGIPVLIVRLVVT